MSLFNKIANSYIVIWFLKILKQLLPFIIILVFWKEIDAFLGSIFPFWNEYFSTISSYLINATKWLRSFPILDQFFILLDKGITFLTTKISAFLFSN